MRSVVNSGVQRVKQQANFYNIAAWKHRVTGSQGKPVYAAVVEDIN